MIYLFGHQKYICTKTQLCSVQTTKSCGRKQEIATWLSVGQSYFSLICTLLVCVLRMFVFVNLHFTFGYITCSFSIRYLQKMQITMLYQFWLALSSYLWCIIVLPRQNYVLQFSYIGRHLTYKVWQFLSSQEICKNLFSLIYSLS